jgi:hypothetical protein
MPPESTILSHPFSCRVSATLVELVTNVRSMCPGYRVEATCQGVVPAENATVSPSCTKSLAARAMATFSVRLSLRVCSKCGSAALDTGIAPP